MLEKLYDRSQRINREIDKVGGYGRVREERKVNLGALLDIRTRRVWQGMAYVGRMTKSAEK